MCNMFRKDFGLYLREIRIKSGLTQETISFESGISRSHIAMIEAGKRDVTLSALFKISRALNLPLYKLFEFDDLNKYQFDVEDLYK